MADSSSEPMYSAAAAKSGWQWVEFIHVECYHTNILCSRRAASLTVYDTETYGHKKSAETCLLKAKNYCDPLWWDAFFTVKRSKYLFFITHFFIIYYKYIRGADHLSAMRIFHARCPNASRSPHFYSVWHLFRILGQIPAARTSFVPIHTVCVITLTESVTELWGLFAAA